jgi:1-phosphofructokinase/tagatose 6-phosphate kinase
MAPDVRGNNQGGQAFLCVCLNPVIQKTLVFKRVLPGEVNRATEHRVDASGKGVNVARVLAQTGRRAIHLTQAGGVNREWFLSMCAGSGFEVRTVDSGSEIRFCYTVIDEESGDATELVEESAPVGEGSGEAILSSFKAALPECRALIVSGTKAAGFDSGIIVEMARLAKAAGLLLVLDVKGADLLAALPSRPLVVKPNLAEFLSTWPLPEGMDTQRSTSETAVRDHAVRDHAVRDHAAKVGGELFERYGSHLVLTRGALPTWYWDGAALSEEAVEPRRALNPTGSGDAFTAGLTAILADGGTLRDAIREGSRLGRLNAERLMPGSIL